MKPYILLISCCLGLTSLLAQPNKNWLLLPNETLVFACQTKAGKWVYVCKDKKDTYLVYRYGTPQKIALQYPSVLDSASWQQFSFKGYSRGGGKANAAMYYGFLSFSNNGIDYEVYDTWNSEDDKENCGILVTTAGKSTDIKGIVKSRKGYLLALRDYEQLRQEE
jgi:hypothetical protein